jgi:hypothetical protein
MSQPSVLIVPVRQIAELIITSSSNLQLFFGTQGWTLQELQDSQKGRLLEGLKDTDIQARSLLSDLVEDTQAQQRRLFEEGFKDTEKLVRTLVRDLVEGLVAQQRRVIDMKRSI